jgi:tRNA (guanosine-2'-O-)-methyltransferase
VEPKSDSIRPITEVREAKFREVLQKRQPGLTIILENIHDPHNISAMLRTCDAVGILEIYVILSKDATVRKLGKRSSASAKKWVKVHYFDNAEACANQLHEKGFKIYATHLSAEAQSLYSLELSSPVALAFGNEHYGCTDELLKHADGNFIIPMVGMIQSLNVSVACAISLYEALRQRDIAGMYSNQQLNANDFHSLLHTWSWK